MILHKTIICEPNNFDSEFEKEIEKVRDYFRKKANGGYGETLDESKIKIYHAGNTHYIIFYGIWLGSV